MAAVLGLDGDVVARTIVVTGVVVATDNASCQVVISGARDELTRAGDTLSVARARRIVPLRI